MKLLALSQWFPYPPDNGSRLRIYNLLKNLAPKHSIRLLAFHDGQTDPKHMAELNKVCEHVEVVPARDFDPTGLRSMAGLFSMRPRSSVDLWSPEMAAVVRRELIAEPPEAILAFTLRCAEYVADCTFVPKVLDLENAEAAYIRRLADAQNTWSRKVRLKLTWVKLVRHERRLIGSFDCVLTVSEEDRDELIKTAPGAAARVSIVPNGVDISLLNYQGPRKEQYRIISTGALTYNANYDANLLFCREILPRINKRIPKAEFVITGAYKQVDVRPFVEAGAILTGFVPDIRPEVARSAVLVAPLRFGGGTRLKILEAMALGTPVVSTATGAMGIGAVSGKHLLLAEEPAEFADAVCRILEDEALALKLAAGGRELVAAGFGWDAISAKLDSILENIGNKVVVGNA